MSSDQQDQSLNIHRPYYLHLGENPATALVSPVLDSSNYSSWSRSMLTALSAKNKVEFVDGSIQGYASNHPLHAAWKRTNNMVVSWMVHSVSPSIRQSILWMDDARDIWKDLKSRYSQGDLLRISELQQDMASIRQGDKTIIDYFTRLRIIWDELESYQPDPFCTCNPKCTCDALVSVVERKKQDQVIQFLRGLNDQFSTIKSNVLMMDPLPDIARVFSYAVQQERQINSNDMIGNNSMINAASTSSSNSGLSFTYCGKDNHTVDRCFRKNGFPQLWFQRRKK